MGSIKLPHASGNSMSIAAPATNPASDLELKLPATVGTVGQVLSVDGSGNLVWTDNTPMWLVKLSSNYSHTSTNTWVTAPLATETFDTDSAFNTSTYTFTVPSGKAGKYFLYAQAGRQGWDSDRFLIQLQKTPSGGSAADLSASESHDGEGYHTTNTLCIADLSVGDAIKVNVYHNSGSTRTLSTGDRTTFQGFKLI